MTHKQLSTTDGNVFALKSTDTLLEKTAKLSKISGVAQVMLDMCLALVKREEAYKELGFTDFTTYYTESLGRLKSEISKSLTRGEFLLNHPQGFTAETAPEVNPTNLYTAITVFRDKDQNYILSAAQTNTVAEILENKRDDDHPDCKHKNTHPCTACDDCGNHARDQEPF